MRQTVLTDEEWERYVAAKGWGEYSLISVDVDSIPANDGPPETVEEKSAQKLAYILQALERKPPSEKQLRFLARLGFGGSVANGAQASRIIDQLLAKRRQERWSGLDELVAELVASGEL